MTAPGTILRQEAIETTLHGARAWRIHYTSRDVNGRPTESTGLVIAPTGSSSDRPVLTWCHGTTGLGDAACPSAQPDPARDLTLYFSIGAEQSIDYGIPAVQSFIDDGWVVCATDYQGLGTPGMHQYNVNRSNALDALNIVHASRHLDTGAGTIVGCMGWSQGGGAAAAIAELDADDYGDLRLIGTVPMSPAISAIAMANPVGPAAALTGGQAAPDSHLVMIFAGHAQAFPELDLSDILTPLGIQIVQGSFDAQPVHHLNDTIARLFRLKGAVLDVQKEKLPAWIAAMTMASGGQHKPICPVLLCIDAFDGGTVVTVPWQTDYADAIEKLGGTVTTKVYPNDDHFSLPSSCVDDARAWLNSLR